MADLTSNFIGIKSPNPFWLASAPPTDKEYNVGRAFKAGWGGVVWKTLGEDPAVVNVNGPRYGAIHGKDRQLIGLNNIELITDRPLEINLEEITRVKKDYPDRAVVVSLMVPCEEGPWRDILRRVEDTGADGVELNFGCPHGMAERGMGSAVGQVPEAPGLVLQLREGRRARIQVRLHPVEPVQLARGGQCHIVRERLQLAAGDAGAAEIEGHRRDPQQHRKGQPPDHQHGAAVLGSKSSYRGFQRHGTATLPAAAAVPAATAFLQSASRLCGWTGGRHPLWKPIMLLKVVFLLSFGDSRQLLQLEI